MINLAERCRLGVLGLALMAAPGCRDSSNISEDSPTVANGYKKLDENTFVIHGGSYASSAAQEFGGNLANFRKEVSGDFIIMPVDSRHPFHYDVLAVRRTVQVNDGKENLLDLRFPSQSK